MFIRATILAALVATGCATGNPERGASPTAHSIAAPTRKAIELPGVFRRAPWLVTTEPDGQPVLSHAPARLRFAPRAAELERSNIHVYDERRNDVGFFYGGRFAESSPRCIYGLSVYVYPATEPLRSHLEAVRAEIVRANPDARTIVRVIDLDDDHGGIGVHAGYLNEVDGVERFEGVSVYERAGWFIKYRTTMVPGGEVACGRRIRAAVADLQARCSLAGQPPCGD
jgi:hypothetical protein